MRQQWVGVNRVHVFLVTGEQEQAVAVQTGCQIFTAKLDDVMTFPLALAGVQAFRQGGERKAELGEELPLG